MRSATELRDGPQHGKEVMPVARVNRRDPVLMIALQEVCTDVSADDLPVVERESRIDHIASDHPVRFREVVLVVAVGTSERDDRGNGIAATTRPTRPLLVVRAAGWHVAQRHP